MNPNFKEFAYLSDKIASAEFSTDPFNHIYVENFLSDEHLELLIASNQINLPCYESTKLLVESAIKHGWSIIEAPGCVSSLEEYLEYMHTDAWPCDSRRSDKLGLALSLTKILKPRIKNLTDYLASDEFVSVLNSKFEITESGRSIVRIQKYLSGYEISPHPDTRRKLLTYLININTDESAELLDIHTQLGRLVPEKQFIYEFWKHNTLYDRDWLPWDWVEIKKVINKNNSLIMFAPSNDTLHGVKVDYDHLAFQRTQIYGSIFKPHTGFLQPVLYTSFDIKPCTTTIPEYPHRDSRLPTSD